MAQDAASAQPAPRRGSIFGDILVGAHFTAFDTHEEQVASRHKGDLERLRLSAANDSVPWFEARWRLAVFASGNKVELPLLLLVVINSAVIGLQTNRKLGDGMDAGLMIAQHSCTAIFAAEVLLKLLAFGPWLYFTNGCGRARRVFFGDPRTRARARGPVKRTRARNVTPDAEGLAGSWLSTA